MKFTPGMTAEEVAAIEDALIARPAIEPSAPQEKPLPPKYWGRNHEDMGTILVDRHKDDLRFINDRSKSHSAGDDWAVWNGQFWDTSASAAVQVSKWQREMTAELKEAVRAMLDELLPVEVKPDEVDQAAATADEQDALNKMQKAFYNFYKMTKSDSFQRDWRNQIKIRPEIQACNDEFDKNTWLLNCKNGTLNIETGQIIPFRREDFLTKQINVEFDPAATAPVWERFLNRIFQKSDGTPDVELIEYLQKAIGYSITGQTSEEAIFICWGTGGNGKSKFLGAISDLLGPYAAAPSIETFLDAKRNSQGASEDVATLFGARLAVATEPDDGRRLATGLLKRLSGRDELSARFLYKNSFKFKPTHKLWLLVNDEPQLNGADGGMKRRLRKISFTAQIKDDEVDTQLDEKLRRELPGILNWALKGALAWKEARDKSQGSGLKAPDSVTRASDAYFSDQDSVQAFIEEKCYVEPTVSTSKPGILYEAYVRFCEQNRIRGLTKNAFGRELTKKGFPIDAEGKVRQGIQISNA